MTDPSVISESHPVPPPVSPANGEVRRSHAGWGPRGFDMLARVVRALVEQVDLDQVARAVVEQAQAVFGARWVALWLAEPERGELRLLAHKGLPAVAERALERLSYEAPVTIAKVARQGQELVLSDLQTVGPDLALSRRLAVMTGWQGEVAFPLKARGRLIGILAYAKRARGRSSRQELDLASTLSDLFSLVIENSRVYASERLKRQDLEALAEISEVAHTMRSLDDLLKTFIDRMVAISEAEAGVIFLRRQREGGLAVRASFGLDDEQLAALGPLVKADGDFIRRTLEGHRPLVEPVDRIDPLANHPAVRTREWQGALGMPLLARDEAIGAVLLFTRRRAFTEEQARRLHIMADRAALEIDNLRLIEQLRDALRLREEFLSAAAHELKTPITTIRGWVQVLHGLPVHHGPVEGRALAAIERQVDRITRLVADLLEITRITMGRLALQRTRFDLGEVVAEIVEEMHAKSPRHQLILRRQPSPVEADRDHLAEVVHNLLDNAVKYQPQGGPIAVEVRPQDGQAVFTVQDQGVGIPTERQPHIFEPFYEPRPAGASGYIGIPALGLYLSREIVERHGGRIWFESEEGKGTAFHFSVPLMEETHVRQED